MAVGVVMTNGGGQSQYSGKMTPFVVLSCIVAAMGGVIFGYDIGISDKEAILSIPISVRGGDDCLSWHYEKSGVYTVKSGYWLALNILSQVSSSSLAIPQKWWKGLWHLPIPPKIKVFIWRVCCQAIPCLSNLWVRNISSNNLCFLCGKYPETESHAIFWCPEVAKNTSCALSPHLKSSSSVLQTWVPPPPGCLKLNSDVSVRQGMDFIGIGAAIRDCSGLVVAAVSKPLFGNFSVAIGELLALREGLLLAKRFNLLISLAEVDAAAVASMLNSDDSYFGDAMFIVSDVKALFSELGGCSCQAVPRKSNSLAHDLAALAFSSVEELLWRDVHPCCIFFSRG